MSIRLVYEILIKNIDDEKLHEKWKSCSKRYIADETKRNKCNYVGTKMPVTFKRNYPYTTSATEKKANIDLIKANEVTFLRLP